MTTARIRRPRLRVVGGVCAGLAEHLELPLAAVRAAVCVLALCGGGGLLLYLWLWATTPVVQADDRTRAALTRSAGSSASDPRRTRAPIAELLLGSALVIVAAAMIASRLGASIPLSLLIPVVVILVGVVLAWRQFDELRRGQALGTPSL